MHDMPFITHRFLTRASYHNVTIICHASSIAYTRVSIAKRFSSPADVVYPAHWNRARVEVSKYRPRKQIESKLALEQLVSRHLHARWRHISDMPRVGDFHEPQLTP